MVSGIMDPNATYTLHGTAVVSTLDGVTTVLVAFLFVCLIFPSIVKNRSQYYAALAAIILVLALHTLTLMLHKSEGFIAPAGVFTGVLQITALILLVLSVGGLTARQLAGDMARAYEVMRRGETEKEVIIPIGGAGGGGRQRGATSAAAAAAEEQRTVYHIDTGQTPGHAASAADDDDRDQSLPLS
jgi:hypothetical protein